MVKLPKKDSRLCKRFPVEDGVIDFDSVLGEIIDISFSGLAFRYSAFDEVAESATEFGAIFGGGEVFLDNIPLRSTNDIIEAPAADSMNPDMRRRGLAFGTLTPEELAQLARFIKQHTKEK